MPTLLASHQDFDYSKIIFAVVFLLVGFVNWLIKFFKQSMDKNRNANLPPVSDEEIQARRAAIARNLGLQVSWPVVATPPPLPFPARPESKRDLPSHAGTIKSTRREGIAPGLHSVSDAAAPVAKPAHPLIALLQTASAARQAVLMKEILGPPKALQSASDALF
jgi:hypothetical protein